MTEQNRVTPFGSIEAFPLRGALTGNRGILHDGHSIKRFHAHDSWVTCALEFRGRWHEQWVPHHFTWLYFFDEAVAFAAGHRPCAECRWQSYVRYRDLWAEAFGGVRPSAAEMNRQLHAERLVRRTRTRRLHAADWGSLPTGAFVDVDGSPWLVVGDDLVLWTRQGYTARRSRPASGSVLLITPPATVAVLQRGYPVQLDASAQGAGEQARSGPRPR